MWNSPEPCAGHTNLEMAVMRTESSLVHSRHTWAISGRGSFWIRSKWRSLAIDESQGVSFWVVTHETCIRDFLGSSLCWYETVVHRFWYEAFLGMEGETLPLRLIGLSPDSPEFLEATQMMQDHNPCLSSLWARRKFWSCCTCLLIFLILLVC